MPVNFGTSLWKAGTPTSGVFQVETATAAGTISTAGNLSVVVTAAGMAGSPITLSVAVALNDTATQWAAKVRTALNANAVIAAFFTVGGATTAISLTRTRAAANDATMNIAIDNDTSAGATQVVTSTDTTAGVLGSFNGVGAGEFCIDTTNSIVYQNTGTIYRPVWTAFVDTE